MESKKLNIFLSTVNFFLLFVGYQLATSMLLPISSDIEGVSQIITIPYRAFSLLISLSVIAINIKNRKNLIPKSLAALLFFWVLLIIRIFYDTVIRTDITIVGTTQLWLYIFAICLPAIFSITLSYKSIDLNKALKWVFWGTFTTLVITILSNPTILASDTMTRQSANIGMNTISLGHLGVMGVILSLWQLIKGKRSFLFKVLCLVCIAIAMIAMLRSGSRGPLLALGIVLVFWGVARLANKPLGRIAIVATSLLLLFSMNSIIDLIGSVAPFMKVRLEYSLEEGGFISRVPYYQYAWEAFLENPIFGKQFAVFNSDGTFIYSHNLILDAFMGLGIVGGLLLLYILWKAICKSYVIIKHDDNNSWIFLILLQQIIYNMLSGAFYFNPLINGLLAFVFIYHIRFRGKLKKKIN